MRINRWFWITPLAVLLVAGAARGDWDVGDGHKMHFPQLPDPLGWDVKATQPKMLADDWLCTDTGPVSDIHFWGSWQLDLDFPLVGFVVQIYSNVPADVTGPFSHPGELLWSMVAEDFTIRPIDPPSPQGWYDPNTGFFNRPDHSAYFQYNLTNIADPFIQQQGQIYWLAVSAMLPAGTELRSWGWKTSLNHFEDDAVWGDFLAGGGPITQWQELIDPVTGQSLDLAFVITPEPGTLALLLLGGLLIGRGIGSRGR